MHVPGRGTCRRSRRSGDGAPPRRRRCPRDAARTRRCPRSGGRDRRRDVLGILGPEQAVLAGMGIEAAHRDAGCVEEPRERLVGQRDHIEHSLDPHPLDRFPQRTMRAHVGDRERAVRQHHRRRADARQSSAIISVCPTNAASESCVASLFIGIVTNPATRPLSASIVARLDVRACRGARLPR